MQVICAHVSQLSQLGLQTVSFYRQNLQFLFQQLLLPQAIPEASLQALLAHALPGHPQRDQTGPHIRGQAGNSL